MILLALAGARMTDHPPTLPPFALADPRPPTIYGSVISVRRPLGLVQTACARQSEGRGLPWWAYANRRDHQAVSSEHATGCCGCWTMSDLLSQNFRPRHA